MTVRHMARSYPKGTRVSSDNYDPVPFWNSGMQFVALNYQGLGRSMWLNEARFQDNGGAGYILKPAYLRNQSTTFDPHNTTLPQASSFVKKLTVYVFDARQLPHSQKKDDQDIVDPYVVIEVLGAKKDYKIEKTPTVDDNGFNPTWNTVHEFSLAASELDFLCFRVMDRDTIGSDEFLAHAELPVESIRTGYRVVALQDLYNKPIPGSNLFCRFVLA